MIRTLMDMARAMLFSCDIATTFWSHAVQYAAYIRNYVGTRSNADSRSPLEVLTQKAPRISHILEFGSICTVRVHPTHTGIVRRAEVGRILGINATTKAYDVWIPRLTKILTTKDVMNISPPEKPTGTLQPDANELVFNRASSMPTTPQPPVQHNIARAQRPNTHPIQPIRNLPQNNASIPTPRRSERILNRLGGHVLLVTITKDPQTVKEALNGQYAAEWTAAMKAEIDSLVANGTWILVDKPRGINLVTNKWVFRVKLNSKGEIDKFKARLVARGFTQKYGVDFVDTYSPVIKQSTVRLLLFIALYLDIELIHGAIPAAYVKATMDRAIYMEIPHGIEGDPKTQALLLKKSLYGLNQSGRLWHTEIDTTLLSFGYRRSKLDPCLYQSNLPCEKPVS
ncbi:hypothetical protein Ae201684_019178 [Aphanomyces euteiches]|uniref:Reverse transcriptase Ty1/copia-type domain-containing protein n=1 Tax=Aphanomyces euteiches TaxID=100861 RepID=A0A6G0W2Y5_9STRA|nr:hypothetical protein Ae201684_019178 [Aphanomyces euteiches]